MAVSGVILGMLAWPSIDLAHPWALLGLAGIPVLWWLARPPRPRRRIATAHMAQWASALARLRRRPVRFASLRFWLLAIGLGLVALAATDPCVGRVDGPLRLAVVLDGSASMGALNRGGVRVVERASERLRNALAEQVPPWVDVRYALVSPSGATTGGDPAVLERWLGVVGAGHGSVAQPRVDAVVERLLSTEESRPGSAPAVLAVHDGRGIGRVGPGAATFIVGWDGPSTNAAIVGCRIDDRWPLAGLAVELDLQLAAAERADGYRLEVATEEAVAAREPIAVEFERSSDRLWTARVRLDLSRRLGGAVVFSIRGPAEDALALDDRVEIWVPPPPAPDVAVLGDGPYLRAAATMLADLGQGRVVAADAPRAGFVLAEGGRLEQRPLRSITFGTAFAAAGSEAQPARTAPRTVDWDRRHPILRGLDLSELDVERALPAARLGDAEEVLIEGDGGPLCVLNRRGVHFAFRLADSNLGLLAAFPQLLRRCLIHAYGAGARARVVGLPLLDARESALEPVASDLREQPLPMFGHPGFRIGPVLLGLAALALAVRLYIRP